MQKIIKNPPSSLFLGINGLIETCSVMVHTCMLKMLFQQAFFVKKYYHPSEFISISLHSDVLNFPIVMLLWAGMLRFWWHKALCLAQGALLDAIMMTRLSLIKADVDELQVISHCFSLGYYQGVYEDKSYHSSVDNAVLFSLTHGPQAAHLPLKRWPLVISKGLGPKKPHPNGKQKLSLQFQAYEMCIA